MFLEEDLNRPPSLGSGMSGRGTLEGGEGGEKKLQNVFFFFFFWELGNCHHGTDSLEGQGYLVDVPDPGQLLDGLALLDLLALPQHLGVLSLAWEQE